MLSVVIPVFNAEKRLAICLDSVLNQSYNELEILIIDDGSSDNSYEICKSYKDTRIKLFRQVNGGVSKARNLGIENARGEYITFLDADDWLENDMYAKMLERFKYTDVDIVVGGFVRQHGNKTLPVLRREPAAVIRADRAIPELLRNRIFRGELCDKVYRRSLFEGIRLDEDIAVAEDLLINWQLFHKARKIYYEPIWGYHYVVNEESVCHAYTRKNLTHIRAIEKIMAMPSKSDYINRIVKGIYGRCLASNMLRMLLLKEDSFKTDIITCQKKLRKSWLSFLTAPCLSLRQRTGIIYSVLPMRMCKLLADVASLGQRNL